MQAGFRYPDAEPAQPSRLRAAARRAAAAAAWLIGFAAADLAVSWVMGRPRG